MSGFGSEKGGMPQYPTPTALSTHGTEFLPVCEEAVNANLRNFSQLEGQEGKGASAIPTPAKEKIPRWKRSLFIIVPLLVVFATVIVTALTLFHHGGQPAQHITPNPATLFSSVTLTKRQTVTITSTQTFTAPIAPSIAASVSSFYASWSANIASANSVAEAQVSEWLTISTTPTITVALPSINMDPSSPPPASTTAAFETPVSAAPTTLSTVSRSGPTGANFCGLPGTFCFNGKRDTNDGELSQDTQKIVTVWKYPNFTTTTTSTRTQAPFPASIMDAYNSYLEQGQASIPSATFGFANSVLSTIAPPSASAGQPNPINCVTSSTAGAEFVDRQERQLQDGKHGTKNHARPLMHG